MADYISRQAIIDRFDDYILDEVTDCNGDTVREILESLQSAQPEPHWIPCRKELPPDDRTVLVTLKWGEDDREISVGEYWHDSPSSKGWGTFEGHVIAWMPLPKPYKDGE